MVERDTWRNERECRQIPLNTSTTTTSSPGTAYLHTMHSRDPTGTAHLHTMHSRGQGFIDQGSRVQGSRDQGSRNQGGYLTPYQDPSFLSGPPPNQLNHAQASLAHDHHTITAKDGTIFIGAGADGQIDPHATAHHTMVLNSKEKFGKEFCYSIQVREVLNKEISVVGIGDEPGKWLVDSGASNHYSLFKHLFLFLIQYNPLVDILTGNRWIVSQYYSTIPLVLLVDGKLVYVCKEDMYFPKNTYLFLILKSCENQVEYVMWPPGRQMYFPKNQIR